MRSPVPIALVFLAVVEAVGCGGGSSSSGSTSAPPSNSVPSISSTSPTTIIAGGTAFTLTVNGSNFISTSTVQWNGSSRTTSYITATQLTASITAADIATTGTASVAVENPAPGGGVSQAISVTVNNPLPTISSLSPASTSAGGTAFTLTVSGSSFVLGATVQWGGSNLTTTYVSATQLSASVPASDIATGETVNVAVVNPTPGGGITQVVSFTVNNPLPTISALSPLSTNSGGPALTLAVSGTNFSAGSKVQWNGVSLTTTYVSATQLTASVPSAETAAAGSANVTVENPAPGGGSTPTASFVIHGAIPANAHYVATTGNNSNPGTITQPFLTIQHCASAVTSGGTCVVRAGSYHETVIPNSGITITSYYGEAVTVHGDDPVTGWIANQGSIYRASATLGADDTNQVFVNGQMMTEARWPNGNDLFHVNWATAQTGTSTTQIFDSNLPNFNWTGARIHLWSGTDPWAPQTGVITASGTGQVNFTLDGASSPPYIEPTVGGYYYLFGILAALDTDNEWFYDQNARVLYVQAPGGVNPSTLTVTAKQRQYAFDLSGVSNVTLEGINIFASTINSNASSTNNMLDAINAQYVSQYSTLPDSPGYSGSYPYDHVTDSGIMLNGTGNVLRNSIIAWSAGNGIALMGNNNSVDNNLVYNVGYMAEGPAGITLIGTGQTIKNNTIHSTGRGSLNPTYAYVNGSRVEPTSDEIDYNNLFSAMLISRDGAEIYSSEPGTGTSIDHNWFHDTQSIVTGAADNYPLAGVYLDEDSSGWTLSQNVFWNNEYDSIYLNGSNDGITSPNNNMVENNTIPDVKNTGYIFTDLNTACGTTQVVNNLVLVPVTQTGTACTATNNGSTAPGATQMNSSLQVGCTLAGCWTSGPPAIAGTSVAASVAVSPVNVAVTASQTATFTVIADGSPTISYQWEKNGGNISGATGAAYTTPTTSAADNGSIFTVQVSNSIGGAISIPATLTVH